MKLTGDQIERISRRLWELQENFPEFEGMILASISGLVLVSTLPNDAYLQRGAAVSATLLLLGEHALQAWRGDETEMVYIKVTLDEPPARYVVLCPVGTLAVLIVISRPTHTPPPQAGTELQEAIAYTEAILHEK